MRASGINESLSEERAELRVELLDAQDGGIKECNVKEGHDKEPRGFSTRR